MRSLVSDTLSKLTTSIETELKPFLCIYSASVLKLLENISPNASTNRFLQLHETTIHKPASALRDLAFAQLHAVHCSQPPDLRSCTAFLTTSDHSEGSIPAGNRLTCTRSNLCLECSGTASLASSMCSLVLDGTSSGFGNRLGDMSNPTQSPFGISEFGRRRTMPVPVATSAASGDDPRVRVMSGLTKYPIFLRLSVVI